jgi:hypothetical protein
MTTTTQPKAAAAILALPGVESLEREADGLWCCHLRFGWTSAALGGGGTIIDANLKTIRAYVRGAYALPPAPAPAPAPGSSKAVILQDGAVPVLSFKPGRFDGPYVAGDGIELWSFSSEAAALRYCQALRREGAEPVALAENALGQWRPILPGEAVPPAAPAPLSPAPVLPAFVTHQQQQQQPQQAPAAALPVLPPADKYSAPCPVKAPAPTCLAPAGPAPAVAPAPVVAPGPRTRNTAPLGLPADAAALLQRFGLSLDGLLTAGASSPKLSKGDKVAASVILHHLPARSLGSAVYGAENAATAPRSRLAGLQALAALNGIEALVSGHNGCPWASKGCSAGCLAWLAMGASVPRWPLPVPVGPWPLYGAMAPTLWPFFGPLAGPTLRHNVRASLWPTGCGALMICPGMISALTFRLQRLQLSPVGSACPLCQASAPLFQRPCSLQPLARCSLTNIRRPPCVAPMGCWLKGPQASIPLAALRPTGQGAVLMLQRPWLLASA